MTKPFAVEVLATGLHSGVSWSRAELDELVRNHQRLKDLVQTPVLLMTEKAAVQPALGFVSQLRRIGDKLIASISDSPIADLLRAGRYSQVQTVHQPAWQTTASERRLRTGIKGRVLTAVAFNAQVPPDKVSKLTETDQPLRFEETADTLRCTLGCATAEEDRVTNTERQADALEAEVRELDNQLEKLSEAQRALSARWDRINCTAFAPAQADQEIDGVGYDAHAFLAAVEGRLQLRGWNRDNPADRRRAAEEVLVEWQRENPENVPEPADYSRVIAGFVPSGGDDSRPNLLAPKPGVGKPVKASESAASLYGPEAQMAEELGGVGGYAEGVRRVQALKRIATAKGLRLNRADEREQALRLLFEQVNPMGAVMKAVCFDEASWCIARNRKLGFAEVERQRPDLAQAVARVRPDLVADYRAGRDQKAPVRRPREPGEAADALDHEARIMLSERNEAATPENLARARKTALAVDPTLAPGEYGWRGRKW